MSVISNDGKIITAEGKALSFGSLIDKANTVTGANDTTLALEGYYDKE